MANPMSQQVVSKDELVGELKKKNEIIQNLRMQLETHRHMMRSLAEMPSEHMRVSVLDFLKLPWGMK